MPKYRYKAKEKHNKIKSGVIEAENFEDAIRKITQSGCVPLDVVLDDSGREQEVSTPNASRIFFKKVKSKDVVLFTRKLSDLIEASVPILKSLQLISRQTSNLHFKEIIIQMEENVANWCLQITILPMSRAGLKPSKQT